MEKERCDYCGQEYNTDLMRILDNGCPACPNCTNEEEKKEEEKKNNER